MKNITIIGAGVMGTIILKSILATSKKLKIIITDRNQRKLKAQKKRFPKVITTTDNVKATKDADLILLAVKPQSFSEVAKELKNKSRTKLVRDKIPEKCLVVSIMAGVPIKKIKNGLAVRKVIRAMPNLGAKIGKSITVWTASKEVTTAEKKIIKSLFDKMGRSLYVHNEMMIDKATAVSGSGPGFFFYLIEQWLKAVEDFGFTKNEAQLLLFTAVDTANDLLQKEKNPELLKNQVASKGGITEAGLKVMQAKHLDKLWKTVLQAAYQRAKQLAKLN